MRGVRNLITGAMRGPEGGRNLFADAVNTSCCPFLLFFFVAISIVLAVVCCCSCPFPFHPNGTVALNWNSYCGDLDDMSQCFAIQNHFSGTPGTKTQITCSRFSILGWRSLLTSGSSMSCSRNSVSWFSETILKRFFSPISNFSHDHQWSRTR